MSAAVGVLVNSVLWAIAGVLGGLVQTLAGPAQALLQGSLTEPYPFGAGAETVWAFARGMAVAGLSALVAYGALRHMLGSALGLRAATPGLLIARLAVAAVGTTFTLTLVNWLLQANQTLIQAMVRAGSTEGGLVAGLLGSTGLAAGGSLTAAAVDVIAPELLALVCLAAALWVVAAYYLRAAEILLLGALAPVAAALWLLPETSGVWGAVVAETVVAIFTQAAQLLVVWLAASAGMAGSGGPLGNLLLTLALLVMLTRVRPLLQAVIRGGRPTGGWGAVASWRAVQGVSAGAATLAGRVVRGVMP